MDSTLIVPLLSAGAAGVFCVLFVLGLVYPRSVVTDLKAEIAELKSALEAERSASSTAVAATTATKDILEAIRLGREIGSKPAGS